MTRNRILAAAVASLVLAATGFASVAPAYATATSLADGDQLFIIQKGNGGNGNTEQAYSVALSPASFAIGTPLGSGASGSNDIYGATYNDATGYAYYLRGPDLIQVDPNTGDMTTLGATSPTSFRGLECIPGGRCFTQVTEAGVAKFASFDITTMTATPIGNGTGLDVLFCGNMNSFAYDAVTSTMYVNNVLGINCRYTVNIDTGVYTPIPNLPSVPGGQTIDAAFDSNGVMWFGGPTNLYSWVPGENTVGGPFAYKLADGTTGINTWLQYIVPAPTPDPAPEEPTLPNTGWSAEQSVQASLTAMTLFAFGAASLVVARRRRARG